MKIVLRTTSRESSVSPYTLYTCCKERFFPCTPVVPGTLKIRPPSGNTVDLYGCVPSLAQQEVIPQQAYVVRHSSSFISLGGQSGLGIAKPSFGKDLGFPLVVQGGQLRNCLAMRGDAG